MQGTEPKLYVIATPIGHKDDVTLRALSLFRALRVFLAEDTREFKKLLALHGITSAGHTLHSYGKHNVAGAVEKGLAALRAGNDVGLVSERGTPSISDPGAELVRRAVEEGFAVVPVPGASSVSAAVSISGSTRFCFVGFLPQQEKARREMIDRWAGIGIALVFFESPQRVRDTIAQLAGWLPAETGLFVAREMTKCFEDYRWTTLAAASASPLPEQGEYTLILAAPERARAAVEDAVAEAVALRGMSDKEWAKHEAARLDVKASDLYNRLQEKKRGP